MNVNELFSPEEIDTRIQRAQETFLKVAQDEGIDLDLLTEEEKVAALQDIMAQQAEDDGAEQVAEEPAAEPTEGTVEETGKEASAEEQVEETPASGEITHLDVIETINKLASANGVDLAEYSREEYAELFDKVAAQMVLESDPAYIEEQQKVAAQESLFDHFGRVCARGFHDELNKLAAEEEGKGNGEKELVAEDDGEKEPKAEKKAPPFAKKEKSKDDEKKDEPKEESKEASAMGKIVAAAKSLGAKAAPAVTRAGDAAQNLGTKAIKAVGGDNALGQASANARKAVGAGLVGTGVAGAAAAGKAAMGRDKKAHLEEEALKVARQILIDAGINPDTGLAIEAESDKVASQEEINARAIELLQEKGWITE